MAIEAADWSQASYAVRWQTSSIIEWFSRYYLKKGLILKDYLENVWDSNLVKSFEILKNPKPFWDLGSQKNIISKSHIGHDTLIWPWHPIWLFDTLFDRRGMVPKQLENFYSRKGVPAHGVSFILPISVIRERGMLWWWPGSECCLGRCGWCVGGSRWDLRHTGSELCRRKSVSRKAVKEGDANWSINLKK